MSSSKANKFFFNLFDRFARIRPKLEAFARENFMLFYSILAILIGVIIGMVLRGSLNMSPLTKRYFLFPGEIFLRMFKFVLLPLITSSLIAGFGSIPPVTNSRIVKKALIYFVSTTYFASILGKLIYAQL